jgi:hypothetical protein
VTLETRREPIERTLVGERFPVLLRMLDGTLDIFIDQVPKEADRDGQDKEKEYKAVRVRTIHTIVSADTELHQDGFDGGEPANVSKDGVKNSLPRSRSTGPLRERS